MFTHCLQGYGYSNEPVFDSNAVCKLLSAVFVIFFEQFAYKFEAFAKKVRKKATIRNWYNQIPYLRQETYGKVKKHKKTPHIKSQKVRLSQHVTTRLQGIGKTARQTRTQITKRIHKRSGAVSKIN